MRDRLLERSSGRRTMGVDVYRAERHLRLGLARDAEEWWRCLALGLPV